MKNILKKLALLAIPVLLWLAFFIAFEPNNYFGLKASATSSQPVARVRAYQQEPGTNLILGDSRLAHFDMGLVDSLSGQSWQNLAFGGASLKETLSAGFRPRRRHTAGRGLVLHAERGLQHGPLRHAGGNAEQSAGLLLQPRVQRQRADRCHGHTARHTRYD